MCTKFCDVGGWTCVRGLAWLPSTYRKVEEKRERARESREQTRKRAREQKSKSKKADFGIHRIPCKGVNA